MNNLSLVLADYSPGLIFLILFIYGWMAYALVKRLWPGVKARIHRALVWVHIHTPGWDMSACHIRAIEPVGPDEACKGVCEYCEQCVEWISIG